MKPHDDEFFRREAEAITREYADLDRERADRDRRPRVVPFDDAELDPKALADALDVVAEGTQMMKTGTKYLVKDLIPNYGLLGMLIAYAKVGKTTFALALGAAISRGDVFLDLETTPVRVLVIAAEDPPEYVAYTARHLQVGQGRMTFYRRSHILNPLGLAQIVGTIRKGKYGFVLLSSWQALVRGLVRDENDNAGMARVVEEVKAAARASGVPWLIDAHAGKGEDQQDDADPSKAMRGASAAAGAADYALWLRYGNGTFGTKRRLSGKGRFVSVPPMTIDYCPTDGTYINIGATTPASVETTWRLIMETGALSCTPQTTGAIARWAGLGSTKTARRSVGKALYGRDGVGLINATRNGKPATLYFRRADEASGDC